MLCLPCLGTGQYPQGRTCRRCGGRGELPGDRLHDPMCPYCIGTGRDPFHRGSLCACCDGWGRKSDQEQPSRAEDVRVAAPPVTDVEGGSDGPGAPGEASDPEVRGRLEDLLEGMGGDVEVSEPSLGVESLRRLRFLRNCDLVRVLAYDVDRETLSGVRGFTRELPLFLFRRYRGRELRDRYVMASNEIVFLEPQPRGGGEGGSRLIRVPASFAGEMIEDVRSTFDRVWRAAERLG